MNNIRYVKGDNMIKDYTKILIYKLSFSVLVVITGVIFTILNIGRTDFLGFNSVGRWLIYIGVLMIAVSFMAIGFKKKRKIDERMKKIASESARWTFVSIILFAFIIMIIDGIKPITIPYYLFMSYLICGLLIIHIVLYKIVLRMY